MFKWLKAFLGVGSKSEPTRDEIIIPATPIASAPVVTSIAVQTENKPAPVQAQVAPASKAPAKKAAAKAKAPVKKAGVKKSKS